MHTPDHSRKSKGRKDTPTPRTAVEQDNVFLNGEGDAWFRRSRANSISRTEQEAKDVLLRILDSYSIKPKNVLDVGCSNGWRLALLHERYGARCVGVEPSGEAVRDGRKRFPEIELLRGAAASIPLAKGDAFDLVIVNFVFHWISRASLLQSVAEIDRHVKDGGYLLISDFFPDWPVQNVYHHLPPGQVYTYKMDYAGLYTATNLYSLVTRQALRYEGWNVEGRC